ncbi:MAG: isoprenyl transferase [Maricaulaceae bacterium]|jgi:undecaprenyl diphosphate synthase
MSHSLSPENRPRHVAIIMDGNGRWARARGRPRAFGHREGVEAVRRTVRAAGELGVQWLTLFGFSTENWDRPADEVSDLLDLLRRFVDADLERLRREGVRIRIAGDRDNLSRELADIIERAESQTADNDRFNLTIAFNYGGRDEIARAARRLASEVASGAIRPEDIDAEKFSQSLDVPEMPDVDLLIRTSGEKRISNFLLFQSAYAEYVFTDVLWPEFDRAALEAALDEYQGRDRRFGRVAAANVD